MGRNRRTRHRECTRHDAAPHTTRRARSGGGGPPLILFLIPLPMLVDRCFQSICGASPTQATIRTTLTAAAQSQGIDWPMGWRGSRSREQRRRRPRPTRTPMMLNTPNRVRAHGPHCPRRRKGVWEGVGGRRAALRVEGQRPNRRPNIDPLIHIIQPNTTDPLITGDGQTGRPPWRRLRGVCSASSCCCWRRWSCSAA